MSEPDRSPVRARPAIDVAVIMRDERIHGSASRWQERRWVLEAVQPDVPGAAPGPRLLSADDEARRWLHGGFSVELFRDEAEGYYLNTSSPAPCFFVMWRLQEDAGPDARPLALPAFVTLSYNEAARWLDAQERVDQVAAAPEVAQWLGAWVAEHYHAEPRRRQRPQSFRALTDRFGNAASVTTDKQRGGGHV